VTESITVDAGHGMTLTVSPPSVPGRATLAYLRPADTGDFVVLAMDRSVRVAMTGTEVNGIWIGSTSFTLAWKEALKVADFLRLDIPLPVPLGEQVPT
jgi:hypothetical protein